MGAVDYVLSARDIIAQGFCRDAIACNAEGKVVSSRDPSATSWCVEGAWMAAGLTPMDWDNWCSVTKTARELAQNRGYRDHLDYNSTPERTQAEMIDYIEEIASVLGAEE